ncbi:MAG: hypothetical protein MN733_44230 [Nitrososphaera sp.]|nr:hypothetical protein [Nitrososphaera sp.]
MHKNNGVLENSGSDNGRYQSAQTTDRTLFTPLIGPEYSELSVKSSALRMRIYGAEAAAPGLNKHYVRQPYYCDRCSEVFRSKHAMRNHRFQKHSY